MKPKIQLLSRAISPMPCVRRNLRITFQCAFQAFDALLPAIFFASGALAARSERHSPLARAQIERESGELLTRARLESESCHS